MTYKLIITYNPDKKIEGKSVMKFLDHYGSTNYEIVQNPINDLELIFPTYLSARVAKQLINNKLNATAKVRKAGGLIDIIESAWQIYEKEFERRNRK